MTDTAALADQNQLLISCTPKRFSELSIVVSAQPNEIILCIYPIHLTLPSLLIMAFTTHSLTYGASSLTLAYTATGPAAGPLLVFLHGWPGIALNWSSQLSHFAALGYRVIAPDM